MNSSPLIAASLLSADPLKLFDDIQQLQKAGTDWLHIDVMDGHFVPNLTFASPDMVRSISQMLDTSLPQDVHLMVKDPSKFVDLYAKAGAQIITIHVEADHHPYRTLSYIKKLGIKAGIALNPGTPACVLESLIDLVDLVLVMTVNPGFGGQCFLNDQLHKIEKIRHMIDTQSLNVHLEVDGGITKETAPLVLNAGADVLVSGSYIFANKSLESRKRSISSLRG